MLDSLRECLENPHLRRVCLQTFERDMSPCFLLNQPTEDGVSPLFVEESEWSKIMFYEGWCLYVNGNCENTSQFGHVSEGHHSDEGGVNTYFKLTVYDLALCIQRFKSETTRHFCASWPETIEHWQQWLFHDYVPTVRRLVGGLFPAALASIIGNFV